MALILMGDLHFGAGVHDEDKLLNLKAEPDDIVVVLGDAGFVWYGDDAIGGRDRQVLDRVEALGFTVAFIDGNHENHRALNAYPVVEFKGGRAHQLRPHVFHLMRGEIFELCGYSCWAFGGAASPDKMWRTEGKGWWPEEIPSNEEIMAGYEKVIAASRIDYIFTHQVPEWVKEARFDYFDNLDDKFMMKMFDEVYTEVDFTEWWSGHLHLDLEVGDVRILYRDVVRLSNKK